MRNKRTVHSVRLRVVNQPDCPPTLFSLKQKQQRTSTREARGRARKTRPHPNENSAGTIWLVELNAATRHWDLAPDKTQFFKLLG